MAEGIRLIIGLGNPEAQYQNTRHNMGFTMLDAFAAARTGLHPATWQPKDGFLAETLWNQKPIYLLKPLSYMNNSGHPVAETIGYLDISPRDILVISDDLDMPLGRMRLRTQGSPGGHRGILSISQLLGTLEFPRLRIGIGRPRPDELQDIVSYVLGSWTSCEEELIQKIAPIAVEIIERCLSETPVANSWIISPEQDKINAESKENNVEKV